MNTIEQKIINAVQEKLNDGTLERLIGQKIEKCISDSLDDLFKWNGSGKKIIESKLDEVIIPVIERHDFNQYIVKMDTVITEIINNTNLEDNKKILENFRGLMKEPDMKEIKLSEIFKKYCEHVAKNVDTFELEAQCEDGEPYYECVAACMEVEHEEKGWFKSNYDNCVVIFKCEEDESLNCQIKLYKGIHENEWKFSSGADSVDINSMRRMSEFEVFLMTLKRGFVHIIIDSESECDDEIEPDEKPEWSLG